MDRGGILMPKYEWECQECREVTEVDVPMRDYDKPVHCEKCGSDDTRRMISKGTTFNLEGGGWFKDGY
jgi:putative FmdB family regulatory protein